MRIGISLLEEKHIYNKVIRSIVINLEQITILKKYSYKISTVSWDLEPSNNPIPFCLSNVPNVANIGYFFIFEAFIFYIGVIQCVLIIYKKYYYLV